MGLFGIRELNLVRPAREMAKGHPELRFLSAAFCGKQVLPTSSRIGRHSRAIFFYQAFNLVGKFPPIQLPTRSDALPAARQRVRPDI